MKSNVKARERIDPAVDDTDEEVRDDAVVAQALIWSAIVLIPLLLVGSVAFYFWTRQSPQVVQDRSRESVVSLLRDSEAVPIPAFHWTDVTQQAGLDFVHVNGASEEKLLPETMGGGVACFDFDRDGHTDIFFTNSCYWDEERNLAERPTCALYRNRGDGTFEDVTAQVGLDIVGYGMGVAVGDYDGDGWPDLFLSFLGRNRMFRNVEGKAFVDVTEETGLGGEPHRWSTSCGWFDANNNGHLDLVVCNYLEWSREKDNSLESTLDGAVRAYARPSSFGGCQPYLYINDGNGRFTEVAAKAGLHVVNPNTQVPVPKSLGLAFCDIDDDGWMDIFIANDTVQNMLFRNKGDGTFEEIGTMLGVAFDSGGQARGAMGIDVRFIRPDSQLATVIGNFANEPVSFFVRQNVAGVNLMTDEAMPSGIGPPSRLELTFGTLLFDYALDGRLDLVTANGHLETEIRLIQPNQAYRQPPHLYWNTGTRGEDSSEFVSVPAAKAGADFSAPMVGRGAAYLDFDGDGDLDLILVSLGEPPRLLRNDQQTGNRWLHVKLNGPPNNLAGLGALVTVTAAGQEQKQWISPSRSYLSQVEPIAYFGLGSATEVDSIQVLWPGGKRQEISGAEISLDSLVEISFSDSQ